MSWTYRDNDTGSILTWTRIIWVLVGVGSVLQGLMHFGLVPETGFSTAVVVTTISVAVLLGILRFGPRGLGYEIL